MALNQAPIRIFDADLNFRAEISLYESAYFQRLDYGIGEFQIQINLNVPYTDEFVNGAFVQFDYDSKKIGIILETTKKIGEKGKNDQILIVKGKEAKWIFTGRHIIPPAGSATYIDQDSSESVLKTLIDSQAGPGCPDANRRLTNFVIDTDNDQGPQYYVNERNSILATILENLCLATEMGYYIYLNEAEKKLYLDVNFGVDHTAEQTANGQVLFSLERNTIRKGELTESYVNYKNVCYTAGEGQGAARNIRLVYSGPAEPVSWNRYETLLDVKQITADADIDQAGAKRLNETQYQTFASGQFLNYSTYVYGKNFDLGDYVTIKIYDVQQNVKITGVRESWANGKYEIDFDYDKSYPKFDQAVTSRINNIQGTLNNTEPVNIPIGSIIAWHKSLTGVPALPPQFVECNGQTLSDSLSPLNGQTIPNLNGDKRFLRGGATSGGLQGHAMQGHYHEGISVYGGTTSVIYNIGAGSVGYPVSASAANSGTVTMNNSVRAPQTDGVNGTPQTSNETRPINMTVVWIMRIK